MCFQVPAGTLLVFLSFVSVDRAFFLTNTRSRGRPDRGQSLETSRIYLDQTRNNTYRSRTQQYPDPTDWHCHSVTRWRDLGQRHYPRFIKETSCSTDTCFYGFYSCRPEYYTINVLSLRSDDYSSIETALPPQLRGNWMFNMIEIPVSCKCMH